MPSILILVPLRYKSLQRLLELPKSCVLLDDGVTLPVMLPSNNVFTPALFRYPESFVNALTTVGTVTLGLLLSA